MPALQDFILVTEVDRGPAFAGHIFQRKFRENPPDFQHHVVTFYRKSWDQFVPFSYVHIRPFGDIYLVGGASTDGRGFELMSQEERDEVRSNGGVYLNALRYAFAKFADRCDAFFGYCGDPRAYVVDMQAGFEPTMHDKLIVHWHKPLDEVRRRSLVAKAQAIGPF
jgi:hypothetical protein